MGSGAECVRGCVGECVCESECSGNADRVLPAGGREFCMKCFWIIRILQLTSVILQEFRCSEMEGGGGGRRFLLSASFLDNHFPIR